MAPAVIHRAWFGPDPLPDRYAEFGRQWGLLNPDHELRLWGRDEAAELVATFPECRRVWDHIATHGGSTAIAHRPEVATATQLADVFGYVVIHALGGVYLNCDMEPLRPLSTLALDPGEAWATQEEAHWVNNGVLGGPAGHPFWAAVLDELPRRFDRLPGAPMHVATGPHLLTDVASRTPGLVVVPKHLFHFVLYHQLPLGSDASAFRQAAYDAGAIALHHWHHRSAQARTDVR